jgi:NAD(P)H-flavin reductase
MASVRKIPCTVKEAHDCGQGVYHIKLDPQERLPRFSAGQFLHLTLDPYDPASFWPESRVFSIASAPSRTEPLEILYSVKGRYTKRMGQELKPGSEVWIKLPYGEFIFDDPGKARIFFAGGTGISAFSALLNAVLKSGQKAPLKLVYGIRNEQLFFYREAVEALAREGLCEQIHLFVEEGALPPEQANLSVRPGRIDFEAVWPALDAGGLTDFYLAGPPVMLDILTGKLREKNVPDSRIYVDKWE